MSIYQLERDEDVDELRRLLAESVSPAVRGRAAAALGEVADPAPPTVEELVAIALEDEEAAVRAAAVEALDELGEAALRALFFHDVDGNPDSREHRPIRRYLAATEHDLPAMRMAAAAAIGADDEAVPVRQRAVEALGGFGRERQVERLVECLADEPPTIRRAAVLSIVESLSNAPPGRSHELRTAIVDGLTTTSDDVVAGTLVGLLEDSAEAHQRRNAVWLLGRVSGADEAAVDALIAALGDDEETVSRFAATGLAEMKPSVVEGALLEALDGYHGAGRSMVLFTLGMVGSERSRERLVELLDETDDVETQERILSTLSKLGGVERAG